MFIQVSGGAAFGIKLQMTAWTSSTLLQAAAASEAGARFTRYRSLLIFSTLLALFGMSCTPLAAASSYDQVFMRHEVQVSAYELAFARLGLTRAHRPEIRAYAQTLINDHAQYNEALRDLAQSKGVSLPPAMNRRHRQRLDRLAITPGNRFDAAFLRETGRINKEGMRAFRAEANRTADPEVREFVLRFLEVDEKHDSLAKSMSDTVIASGAVGIRPPRTDDHIVVVPPPDRSRMPVIQPLSDAKHGMPSRN